MAIGNVSASGGMELRGSSTIQDRSGDIRQQSTSNLFSAIKGAVTSGMQYLGTELDLEAISVRRANASEDLEIDTQLAEFQSQRAQRFEEFTRENTGNPRGMTQRYFEMLGQEDSSFQDNLPDRQRERVNAMLRRDTAERAALMFREELNGLDRNDKHLIERQLNLYGSSVRGGSAELEAAQEAFAATVTKSGLDPQTKAELIAGGRGILQAQAFSREIEEAVVAGGTAREWRDDGSSGKDVVAAGLAAPQRAMLNTIAGREAGDYNVWNGNSRFNSFADHPAATNTAPGASTAAGRYQFILSTWRAAAKSYEDRYGVRVPDFTPEWQDRVAIHWAELVYNRNTKNGVSFQDAVNSGDPALLLNVRRVLGNPKDPSNPDSVEWEGWADRTFLDEKKGIVTMEQAAAEADRQFLALFTGTTGVAAGGTGSVANPDVWNDPRYQDIGLSQKETLANAAAKAAEERRKAMAAATKAANDAFLDTAYNTAYMTGDVSTLDTLRQDPAFSPEAEKKWNEGYSAYQAKTITLTEVQDKIDRGIPLTSRDDDALGMWMGAGVIQGITTGEDASMSRLREAATTVGRFPSAAVAQVKAGLADDNTNATLLQSLAAIYATRPEVLYQSNLTAGELGKIETFTRIAENSGTFEEAAAKLSQMRTTLATSGKSPTILKQDAGVLYKDTIDLDRILTNFEGIESNGLSGGVSTQVEALLAAESRQAYSDGYLITGTPEGAEAYMDAAIKRSWGVTYTSTKDTSWEGYGGAAETVTRGFLMKNPPENFYPPAAGEYAYIHEALYDFVAEGLGMQPEFNEEGLPVKQRPDFARMVADKQTQYEIDNGKPPTYTVVSTDEFGGIVVLPGRFGGEELAASAAEITRAQQEKDVLVSEVGAREAQYDHAFKTLMDVRTKGTDEEIAAALEQAEVARQGLRSAEIAANERGVLGEGRTITPPEASEWLTATKPHQIAQRNVNRSLEFLDPANTENQQRINSLTAQIVKSRRKEDGSRYNNPQAKHLAIGELLAKELGLDPTVAQDLADRYRKGTLK